MYDKMSYALPTDAIALSEAYAAVLDQSSSNWSALTEECRQAGRSLNESIHSAVAAIKAKDDLTAAEEEEASLEAVSKATAPWRANLEELDKHQVAAAFRFRKALFDAELQAFVLDDRGEWCRLSANEWSVSLKRWVGTFEQSVEAGIAIEDFYEGVDFVGPHLPAFGPDTRLPGNHPDRHRRVFLRRSEFQKWLSSATITEDHPKKKGDKPGPKPGSGPKFQEAMKKLEAVPLDKLEMMKESERVQLTGFPRGTTAKAYAAVLAKKSADK